jgi:hypothetical protein
MMIFFPKWEKYSRDRLAQQNFSLYIVLISSYFSTGGGLMKTREKFSIEQN